MRLDMGTWTISQSWRPVAVAMLLARAAVAQEDSFPTSNEEPRRATPTSQGGLLLADFLRQASERTGKPFVLGPSLENAMAKRRVQFMGELQPSSGEDLFEFYTAVLKANDLVLYPIGPRSIDLYLVDDLKSAGPAGVLRAMATFVPPNEIDDWRDRSEMITTIVPLVHLDLIHARQELGQLVNTRAGGAITTLSESNALVITDFAPTVWSVVQLLKVADRQDASHRRRFRTIPLAYARAQELVPILVELVDGDRGGERVTESSSEEKSGAGARRLREASARIVADPRTNSVVLSALDGDASRIRDVIAELDRPVDAESRARGTQGRARLSESLEEPGNASPKPSPRLRRRVPKAPPTRAETADEHCPCCRTI